jgi:hypothetical protein
MPTLDVQEPCACRTSQGFFTHACSQINNPERALPASQAPCIHIIDNRSNPIIHCTAHRVHPDFRSSHLPERRKWIPAEISLISKYTAANTAYIIYWGTSDCLDPFRTPRSIDRLTAASGPALSLTQYHGDGQMPMPNESTLAKMQYPEGPDCPFAKLTARRLLRQ